MARPSLRLTLLAHGADLPDGSPLKTLGDLRGSLRLDGAEAHVALALADRPIAELRWLVDGVVRKVAKALDLDGAVRLDAGEGVASSVVEAVALDLGRAFGASSVTHPLGDGLDAIARDEALYRAWVDEDATIRTSVAIARDVTAWAETVGDRVEVEVHDRAACEALGLRLLVAVGGASTISPPTLVVARYTPPDAVGAPWMLLGKGITFDSGGVNVKPYESFVSMMKNDMAGAALAFALFKHLVEARCRRPLVLVIPTCENPVGEDAMRPGSIVKSYRGLDVRIDHTDAEGRLILADALAWAGDRFEPERVLSFATLTTAALIAYGPYATPVHFAPPELEAALTAASAETGEDLHFFPERVWHLEANRDEEADVKNTARLPGHAARGTGSRNAGHFLLHFTDRPLTHLDIFASTWNWAGDAPGCRGNATGTPIRTLARALLRTL